MLYYLLPPLATDPGPFVWVAVLELAAAATVVLLAPTAGADVALAGDRR